MMPYGEESVGSEVLGISRVANASEEICFHDAIVLVVHLLEVFSWIVTAAPTDARRASGHVLFGLSHLVVGSLFRD